MQNEEMRKKTKQIDRDQTANQVPTEADQVTHNRFWK